jgi:hypothetical protein
MGTAQEKPKRKPEMLPLVLLHDYPKVDWKRIYLKIKREMLITDKLLAVSYILGLAAVLGELCRLIWGSSVLIMLVPFPFAALFIYLIFYYSGKEEPLIIEAGIDSKYTKDETVVENATNYIAVNVRNCYSLSPQGLVQNTKIKGFQNFVCPEYPFKALEKKKKYYLLLDTKKEVIALLEDLLPGKEGGYRSAKYVVFLILFLAYVLYFLCRVQILLVPSMAGLIPH